MGLYNKTQRELEKMHWQLMHEQLSVLKMAHIITVLAKNDYVKAKKDIATFLNHPKLLVKENALIALTLIWIEPKYKDYCLHLLHKQLPLITTNENDPEYYNQLYIRDNLKSEQCTALFALGHILRVDKDVNILKFFVDYVTDESKQWSDREIAYDGILDFLDIPHFQRKHVFKSDKEIKKYIDWKLIEELKKKYKI